MKKTIGILSHRRAMADFYAGIFRELLGDTAEIVAGAIEDGTVRRMPQADLYVSSVTAYDVKQDSSIREVLAEKQPTVRLDVNFPRAAVDLLLTYPEGTRALLVNQNKHMTMECIGQLYHLGISNIEFYPCYPGAEVPREIGLAITVGEPDLVPQGVERVVDIGSRLPGTSTICEVALRLGDAFFLETRRFKRYRSRLAEVDYSLQTISSNNLTAENRLEIILNSLEEGIVCVNENGLVTLINKTARRLLNVERSEVLNRPAAEALPCLPFADWEAAGLGSPRLLNLRGTEFAAVLSPLMLEGESLGSFLTLQTFRAAEELQTSLRLQKTRRSHIASYRFSDIVGVSPAILRAKDLARRMSDNDASILIQGESGAGKGIFAQAIHNASSRAGGPFVAVSCAALRDELLETELFGTAGTGADGAGGRIGLVECAHRGTLFLDGVEHMSPRLQASLLRMLKEKEITRIGSDEPIPVDVRVISSAEQDPAQLVQDGLFLRDLYYRLSVIPLTVPPLRERRADLPLLFEHFRRRLDADFELTTGARLSLLQHRWEGNVREVKNCVEYLKYTGLHMVDFEDLPPAVRLSRAQANRREELEKRSGMSLSEYQVLRELGEGYRESGGLGRRSIAERCAHHGALVSEHEVREAIKKLEAQGLAVSRAGRGGTRLTESGYLHYRQIVYGGEELPEREL